MPEVYALKMWIHSCNRRLWIYVCILCFKFVDPLCFCIYFQIHVCSVASSCIYFLSPFLQSHSLAPAWGHVCCTDECFNTCAHYVLWKNVTKYIYWSTKYKFEKLEWVFSFHATFYFYSSTFHMEILHFITLHITIIWVYLTVLVTSYFTNEYLCIQNIQSF